MATAALPASLWDWAEFALAGETFGISTTVATRGVRLALVLLVAILIAGLGRQALGRARAQMAASTAIDARLANLVCRGIRTLTLSAIVIATLGLAADIGLGFAMLMAGVLVPGALIARCAADNALSGIWLALASRACSGDAVMRDGDVCRLVRIGVTHAEVVTRDGEPALLPNTLLAGAIVRKTAQNGMARTAAVTLRLPLKTNPDQLRKLLSETAMSLPGVLPRPEPAVMLAGIDDTAFAFTVEVAMAAQSSRDVLQSDLRLALVRAVRAHGIELPHVQHDVHLRDLDALKVAFLMAMEERRSRGAADG